MCRSCIKEAGINYFENPFIIKKDGDLHGDEQAEETTEV